MHRKVRVTSSLQAEPLAAQPGGKPDTDFKEVRPRRGRLLTSRSKRRSLAEQNLMNIQKAANQWRKANLILLGLASTLAGCGGNDSPVVFFSRPFTASTINLGQSVKLVWASKNVSTCTASASTATAGAFSGAEPTSGVRNVAPTAPGSVTYTLSCTGPGGSASATTAAIIVNPSILSTLTRRTTIGSTMDPTEHGGNPYGLAIAPITAGLITAGDLIACNFNDGATNTQGLGTTLIGLHPVAGASPYRIAQSSQLQGCSALSMFSDDSISASAFSANLNPLVAANGAVNNPFAANTLHGPWSQAYAMPYFGRPALYVSNQLNGAIDRITLNGDNETSFTEIAIGFCGSGVPGAVFAPAGLTYDATNDTLYIVDTSSYSVVAFANVSSIGADGVIVNGNCSGTTHTPTPALTFSGASASAARVIASGGQLNAPISAALLMDGDLVVANADIDAPSTPNLLFEISPALGFVGAPVQLDTGAPGALFGLAATVDSSGNQLIYFNDDNDNTVKLLSK